MKITFTGKQEPMTAAQERKLATRFGKLSKLIERRGEKDAHVVLSQERHLHRTEVRVNFYDHPLVGIGAAPDQFASIVEAVDKLEKQTVKLLERKRDTKRSGNAKGPVEAPPAPARVKPREPNRKVARPAAKPNGKPMTAAEALLAMEEEQDYMVYHDAETQRKSVLVRRRDGSVDVVEP
jgi:putative sigma-54 modulation protein